MEFLKKTRKVGNSSGVLLPRELLGSEVKIIVVNRPVNIKKESIRLLEKYFKNILGIYIINKKPAEVLAISTNLKEKIEDEGIKISIVPFSIIKQDIKTKQVLRDKLGNAGTILNHSLLVDLKKEIRGFENQL